MTRDATGVRRGNLAVAAVVQAFIQRGGALVGGGLVWTGDPLPSVFLRVASKELGLVICRERPWGQDNT